MFSKFIAKLIQSLNPFYKHSLCNINPRLLAIENGQINDYFTYPITIAKFISDHPEKTWVFVEAIHNNPAILTELLKNNRDSSAVFTELLNNNVIARQSLDEEYKYQLDLGITRCNSKEIMEVITDNPDKPLKLEVIKWNPHITIKMRMDKPWDWSKWENTNATVPINTVNGEQLK